MKKHLGVDTVSRTKNVVGAVPAVAFDAAGIILRTASITRRDLGSLAELVASTLRTRAAAAPLLFNEPLRYSCLTLSVVVINIIRVITAVPRDLARVEPTSAPIIGFNLVALAEAAAAARRTRP